MPNNQTNAPKAYSARTARNAVGSKPQGPTGKARKNPRKAEKNLARGLEAKMHLDQATLDYLRCLLRPDLFTAKIPQPLPIPSCLCQCKGTVYATSGATLGFLKVVLCPYTDNGVLQISNSDAITEATPFPSWAGTTSVVSPTNTYSVQRRVVGAILEVEAIASDLSRTGLITASYLPYNPNTSPSAPGFNFDSLRDQPGTQTYALNKRTRARTTFLPYDPTYYIFGQPNVGAGAHYPSLVVAVAGATNGTVGQQFRISYRVVYEYVPVPTMTDLLVMTQGPQGSHEDVFKSAVAAASAAADSGFTWLKDTVSNTWQSAKDTAAPYAKQLLTALGPMIMTGLAKSAL